MPDIADRAAYWGAHSATGERARVFDAEIRTTGTADTGYTFDGLASVVDRAYPVNDMFGTFQETIRAGAFNKTLKDSKADVGLFLNHDTRGIPLATRFAKGAQGRLTLTAEPDLRFVAALNPLRTDVHNIRVAVDDGNLSQMSIGFSVPKGKDQWSSDYTERSIYELKLTEGSIVWQGANPYTTGSMRSALEAVEAMVAGQLDPAELERMITHLSGLLPVAEKPNQFALSESELETFWAKTAAAATA